MPAPSYQRRGNLEPSKQLAARQGPSSVPLLPHTHSRRCQSHTQSRDSKKTRELDRGDVTPRRRPSVRREESGGSEWWRLFVTCSTSVIWFQSCMFAAFVFSRGHSGLYDFESTSTLRISNYLSEVKRSVSQAHSASLIYYALIPVNSLAGMGKSTCGDSEQRRAKPN